MDIDFGAPPPAASPAAASPIEPMEPLAAAEPLAAEPPSVTFPPTASSAATASLVEEVPGLKSRKEREKARVAVRFAIAATCGMLLLIAYFVLLTQG